LAISNGAWIVSQVAIGFILTDSDYWKVFVLSAIMMTAVSVLVFKRFKDFRDPSYDNKDIHDGHVSIFKNKNLLGILSSSFLLQFFFSWMIIYTPIYLHEHIGFSWSQIGWIFSVMLLPFVITEYPLGKIADKKLGEKELLISGFAIMAITTATMTFIVSPSLWLWMTILFLSRIGASTVEAMTETYFFKKISSSDARYLSLFRSAKPWAYIIGPASATLFLFFYDLRFLFSALAMIMVFGIVAALSIKDTR
jgi:MFS family permease